MSRGFCEMWGLGYPIRMVGRRKSKAPLLAKEARNGAPPLLEDCLQFPPHILEVVEALFSCQPLRRAHGALSEAAAGFGVVAEINAVGCGFEYDLVQADDFALAERSDL